LDVVLFWWVQVHPLADDARSGGEHQEDDLPGVLGAEVPVATKDLGEEPNIICKEEKMFV